VSASSSIITRIQSGAGTLRHEAICLYADVLRNSLYSHVEYSSYLRFRITIIYCKTDRTSEKVTRVAECELKLWVLVTATGTRWSESLRRWSHEDNGNAAWQISESLRTPVAMY